MKILLVHFGHRHDPWTGRTYVLFFCGCQYVHVIAVLCTSITDSLLEFRERNLAWMILFLVLHEIILGHERVLAHKTFNFCCSVIYTLFTTDFVFMQIPTLLTTESTLTFLIISALFVRWMIFFSVVHEIVVASKLSFACVTF